MAPSRLRSNFSSHLYCSVHPVNITAFLFLTIFSWNSCWVILHEILGTSCWNGFSRLPKWWNHSELSWNKVRLWEKLRWASIHFIYLSSRFQFHFFQNICTTHIEIAAKVNVIPCRCGLDQTGVTRIQIQNCHPSRVFDKATHVQLFEYHQRSILVQCHSSTIVLVANITHLQPHHSFKECLWLDNCLDY